MTTRKRASMDLSVNIIVTMILCIIVLGVGIALTVRGISISEKNEQSITALQKRQLQLALDSGAIVSIYPSSLAVQKNQLADFAIGVSNPLQQEQHLYMNVIPATDYGNSFNILVGRDLGVVKPTKSVQSSIGIRPTKSAQPGQYIFNVCVKSESIPDTCSKESEKFGELQKIIVNVK